MSTHANANSKTTNQPKPTAKDDADDSFLRTAFDEGQDQLVAALKSAGKRAEKEIKSRPLFSMLMIFLLGLLLGRAIFRS